MTSYSFRNTGYTFDIARITDLHNHDTLFDDFCSLSLACKLILKEGGHLPFSLQPMKQKDNKPGITKVKWEKVDKEWYEVILRENISSIKHKLVTGDIFDVMQKIVYF
jgi:hypothetical protein